MEEVELNNEELRNKTCNLNADFKTGWFCNKNGSLLKTYEWLVKNAFGIILLIHGFKANSRINFMPLRYGTPYYSEDLGDDNSPYIYKNSWIEKFNQNGYSVYTLDLQGHGESQTFENFNGNFDSFDDLVDDVIQYMNHIQDEISNDNQMDDESHDIVTSEKKRLPMYIIGYSMGGNIALRILQLLNKEKEDRIKEWNSNNYKNGNTMLENFTNINEVDNDMNNYNDYDSDNSCASTSATTNTISSDKDEGFYNYLDKLNIKGCVSLSGMIRFKTMWDFGNNSFNYVYLPILKFLSHVANNIIISSEPRYKGFQCGPSAYNHNNYMNIDGPTLKSIYELLNATITLDSNINYMPKNIPLLFIHSQDDHICCCKGAISLYNKINVNNKKLHIVDRMGHFTTAARGNEDVFKKVIDWISNLRNNEDEKEDEIDYEKDYEIYDKKDFEIDFEIDYEKDYEIYDKKDFEIDFEIDYEKDYEIYDKKDFEIHDEKESVH
ncbi:lysophospholipase, putative [Plasmodium yoelii]|uniref:Lysophospholipase n=2 Tax=Plasmodium yoelii TaxID=5861 RepID=A0AAE9WYA0_PLAYO|nr:lysophospholipase, putative [Plasmodium yoelii]WBY60474.1 lysophospholipase [Plasmodium yoelii yoelii]VTZ81083.1 lysophospholipase, putative [Plasmodium yoelii]|eukprot:XP_728982.2 lysophospholipase, putative [Plasmodium yoelii]